MTKKSDIAIAVVSALKGLVGGRVYRLAFPQSPKTPTWPAIRYTFIDVSDAGGDITGEGGEDTADYRLQIDLVVDSKTGPTAFSDLSDAVKAAMAALAPTYVWDSDREEPDAETKTLRLSVDYMVYLSSPA